MFGTHVGLREQTSDIPGQPLIRHSYGDVIVSAEGGIDGLLLARTPIKLSQDGRRHDNIPVVRTSSYQRGQRALWVDAATPTERPHRLGIEDDNAHLICRAKRSTSAGSAGPYWA